MDKNIESELIGMLLEYPQLYYDCSSIITGKHFRDRLLGDIFSCMGICVRKKNSITKTMLKEYVTVKHEIDLVDYLTMIQSEIPSEGNAIQWAGIIREESDRQAIAKILSEGVKKHEPVDSFVEDLMGRLIRVRTGVREGSRTLHEIMREILDQSADRYKTGEQYGWEWGIPRLKDYLGRLIPGQLYTIIAPSGCGKSSAAMQIVYEVAKQDYVEVFQADMDSKQQGYRTFATLTEISVQSIQESTYSEKEYSQLTEALDDVSKKIIMNDSKFRLLENVKMKCMATKAKHGLGLIVLDHSKLFRTAERNYNPIQNIQQVYMHAKEMAVDLECAVLVLNQITREMSKRNSWEIRITDAYGGEEARENSDVVLLLNRPTELIKNMDIDRKYTEAQKESDLVEWEDRAYFEVAKNRSAATGQRITMDWCPHRTLFYDKDNNDMFEETIL